ncbi:MAG: hypothetical protein OMOMHJEC_02687 [Xanthomonadales bacterium]|nr:hypothetical protein [Xanthomonadales bacterium]
MVPSAASLKGRQSPLGDSAGVFEKHRYMKMSLSVSTPPAMARSLWPSSSSATAIASADSEDAQAASVTQLVPPRFSRLAMRPATTLPSRPGKLASCHGTYCAAIRAQASCTCDSSIPASRSARTHTGRCSRETIENSSSCALVTPRITEIRERSMASNCPRAASSSTCCATINASSCEVSVAGSCDGGTPQPSASKSTFGRKPPRLAYVLSGAAGSGS